MKITTIVLILLGILVAAGLKTCTSGGVMGKYVPFGDSISDTIGQGLIVLIVLFLIRLAFVKTGR